MLRKLLIIIMGIFLGICAGSCNFYPIYLDIMKNKYDYSIKQINLYGVFINIGLWVALPMGLIYDSLGPKISLAIGSILLSGSYLALHLILNSDATEIPLAIFLIIGLLMGQGSALLYTTSVTTNLKNFRFKESSAVVGLLVASLAISPSIFTTYREALGDMHIGSYLLVISIVTFVIILICGFVFYNIRNVYSEDTKSYEKYKEKKVIKVLIYFNIIILGFYTFGVIYNNNFDTKIPLIIIYPCLQMLNFIVVLLEKYKVFDKIYFKEFVNKKVKKAVSPVIKKKGSIEMTNIDPITDGVKRKSAKSFNEVTVAPEAKVDIQNDSSVINDDVNNTSVVTVANAADCVTRTEESRKSDNLESILPKFLNKDPTFWQSIKSINIVLLFIMLVLGIGSVIANINNINFIVNAISKTEAKETNIYTFVILFFVFNSFTRISSGLILDTLITNKKLFYYPVIISVIGFISQILGIPMNKTCLYFSISLAGMTSGGYMTFIPVFVRNEYGLTHMGKILGILTSGCATGSLLISDLLFIVFWETYKEEKNCFGQRCFMGSYIITSCFFMINVCLSLVLLRKYLIKVNK
jgi:hypothetical protein